ncbi:MAG TPA: T9SS type A sorting domain-containing protein, partial [Bacteroidia bacterium]|nr:T9SS type A sorting domain-containing protein [Bacteroidia bacterium]
TDGNGCTNTDVAAIVVNTLPTVSAIASPASTVCPGTMVTLNGSGAVSYVWTGGVTDGVPFAAMTTDTYTVTGTDANGCDNTDAITINVNALPTVGSIASPGTTVCDGSPVILSGTGAASYTWTGGVFNGVPFTPVATATYTVTGTDGNGCTNTNTISVTVNPLPAVSFSASPATTICAGANVTLSGSGATSYTWTGGVTDGVAFAPASTATYTVTGTDAGGCTNTATVAITVNPLPTVSSTANPDSTICTGTSVVLSGTGASTYAWTGGILDGVAFIPASTTSYTVTGTDVNGCSNTASTTITVNPLPTVGAISSPGLAVCTGASVTLNGTGATSYSWSGGVTNNVSFVPPSTASYIVTGTDVNGCSNTATITITVNPLPTVSSSASPGSTVCQGTMVTLSGSGASTYAWTGGITNNVPFAAAATTTYTVTGTDGNGCSNTATNTITVNPAPTVGASASPATTVCSGTSVTLNGTGASIYSWSGGITNNVPFTALATTTYTVTGTDGLGCVNTATITITVNPLPTVSSTATPGTTVCAGTPVTLSGTGATTYTWTGGVTNNVAFTPPSTSSYTVTGTNGNGCTNTNTISITVNPLPTVTSSAAPATTVCAGTSVTLTGFGATSYSWTGGVTNNVPFTASATTTYTVTGTDANGCVNTNTITITVNPLPTVSSTASPGTTVCTGTIVTLNGTGASTYTWSGGISNNVPFVASATASYTVTGTNGSGCTNTATTTITVNPLPTVSSTASPATTVCSGTTVTLNGTGAVSYTWTGGRTNNVPFIATATNTYTVTGTDANGCTNTATTTITVNPLPTVSSTATPGTTVCAGTSVTLNGTGAVSYTWSSGVTNNVAFTPVSTTTYTVTGTNGNGCTNTSTVLVTVNPLPTVGTSVSPAPLVCSGTMVTLSGTGAMSYVWTGGVTDNIPFSAVSTSSYTVTGTDANGCVNTAITSVTVTPAPTVGFSASPGISVCAGTAVTLDGTGAVTYAWSGGLIDGNPFTPLITDTYTVVGTDGSGCTDSAVVTITVDTIPVVGSTVSPASAICENDMITLNGTGAATYTWSHGVTDNVPFAATATTTYTVIGTNGIGCSDTTTQVVTVDPAPVVVITGNNNFCTGGSTALTASSGSSYQWYMNGSPIAGETAISYTATGVGVYNVVVTNGTGCSDSSAAGVNIIINAVPTVVAMATDTTLCAGASVTLTGGGAVGYAWSAGVNNGVGFVPLSTLTYTVTGTDANGCTDTDTLTVFVNALPSVSSTATPGYTVCDGTPVTLSGTGAVSYTWTGGITDGLAFTPLITDSYTVTGTDANGCVNTVSVTVTVNPMPVVNLGADQTQCGGSVVLDALNPGETFLWSDFSTAQTLTVTASGTYMVDVTTAAGCIASDTVVITINAQPLVALGTDNTLCSTNETLNAGNPGATYLWNDNTTVQTLIVTASGEYYVTATMPGGCTSTDTINLVLNTPPVVTLSLVTDTICLNGGVVALAGETPIGGTWTGSGVTGNSFDPMVAGVGTFAIEYMYVDTNGCSGSAIDSVFVDPCLGVEPTVAGIEFTMYPNPNNGEFNITISGTSSASVMVYNAAGQLVMTEKVMKGEILPVSLEVSGMYMITMITAEGKQMTQRVVVNR